MCFWAVALCRVSTPEAARQGGGALVWALPGLYGQPEVWSCLIGLRRSGGWNKAILSPHPSLTSAIILNSPLPIHPIQSINISSYSVIWKSLLYTSLMNGWALFYDLWSWWRMKSCSSFNRYLLNRTERYSFLLLVFYCIWLSPFGTFKSILIIVFLNHQVSFFFFYPLFLPPAEAGNRAPRLVLSLSVPGSSYDSAIRIMYLNHCYFSVSKNVPLENLKMFLLLITSREELQAGLSLFNKTHTHTPPRNQPRKPHLSQTSLLNSAFKNWYRHWTNCSVLGSVDKEINLTPEWACKQGKPTSSSFITK